MAALGKWTADPKANIIKLPNVSASVPQLIACIKELQERGYDIPDFNPEDAANKELYAKVLGSAVNPVLREGNSDRRVAKPVKENATQNPHRMIKPYPKSSKSKVVHMDEGDFYESEKSVIMEKETSVTFELETTDGKVITLRPPLKLEKSEVIDASFMSVKHLREYFKKELLESETMVSLHLKATMMKISDPIIFGHAVSLFYEEVFEKHAGLFKELGVNPNNGIGEVYTKLESNLAAGKINEEQKKQVEADIKAVYEKRPQIAMVDSSKGITNLHVPSDVIIDASMPVVVRDGGRMWGWDDELHDVKCLIPGRCYATIYKRVLEFCKENGEFDPSKMGSVSNVGLMAGKAEEYGSHDKTFEIPADGRVFVKDATSKKVYFEHAVSGGDIWRMCQAKKSAIDDWIQLAIRRGEATANPVVFWLDENRGHDASLIDLVKQALGKSKTSIDWSIKKPEEAMQFTLERTKAGLDTISVSGNALRDYLTDLFPILELGTSAKMLSIVPLLAGGGLYETGAGGSAPKHVQQFVKEGHLRWDSLGEFLALAVSLEDLGTKSKNKQALILGKTLMGAVSTLLSNKKSPSRKVNEIDNRGSHFYLALYWADELVNQTEDPNMAKSFKKLHSQLAENEENIAKELIDCQGNPQDIGGYYMPDVEKAANVMRPSKTFNTIIDAKP